MGWEIVYEHLVEILFSGISTALGIAYTVLSRRYKRMRNDAAAQRNGICALLRNGIIDAYNRYTEKGFIPIYALENVERMYESYHGLGGNGTVTELMERLKELPTQK